jgi:adenylate cyclase
VTTPISSEFIFACKDRRSIISPMRLPSTLAWLVDEAGTVRGADHFLAMLGTKLVGDGLPLAGGALTLTAAHPIIARRTWLWRAETGMVIEALGFGSMGSVGPGGGTDQGKVGRDWLATLSGRLVLENVVGLSTDKPASDHPTIAWAVSRPLTAAESTMLHQAARFAAAPIASLSARATLAALLDAYLGRRGAAQVLAGRSRRETGETIRAVLLVADLRGFTELSESVSAEEVVAALDAWFDRVAGAVHAFGGEVLKFIGDGVLAIFPIGERSASAACDAALSAVRAAQAGMAHFNEARGRQGLPPLHFGLALHLGCGAMSAPPTGWTSPRSVPPSIWSADLKACAARSAAPYWSPARLRQRRQRRWSRWASTFYAASPRPARFSACRRRKLGGADLLGRGVTQASVVAVNIPLRATKRATAS